MNQLNSSFKFNSQNYFKYNILLLFIVIYCWQDNITSVQDYVSYIYLPYQREDEEGNNAIKGGKGKHTSSKILLRFPITAVRHAGIYRLLYFSRNCNSLLGMSTPFNVIQRDGPVSSPSDWWQNSRTLSFPFGTNG